MTDTFSRGTLLRTACAVLLGAAQTVFGQTCDGAGTLFGAHLQRPVFSASAETNGEFELTCTVGLLGGCCFPLTSHAVTAALELPPGLSVIDGPTPTNYPSIDAPPSGTPKAWATFRWRLRRFQPDAGGDLAVTVSSADSGQVRAVYAQGPQTRINISGPLLPETVAGGQKVALAVDASCLDQDRYLKRVRFWYSSEIPSDADAVDVPAGLEERGILCFTAGGRQSKVQGVPLELTRKYEPKVWRGTLVVPKSGTFCGVAIATDDAGRTACGPVVRGAAPKAVVKQAEALGYPVEGSVAAFLFLDASDASRRLAEQMETYRSAAPHRIHVLCFVEGATPATVMTDYRKKFSVSHLPAAVFDGRYCVDGTNSVALTGTLDRCFNKPSPRLSMELHGGVVAGRELSLGFILCNHSSADEVRGGLSAFACESGVAVGGWRCDRVARQVLEENRRYNVPVKKCQAPTLLKWELPKGVQPSQTGALILIQDEAGQTIDSICTEKPCSRTGICG